MISRKATSTLLHLTLKLELNTYLTVSFNLKLLLQSLDPPQSVDLVSDLSSQLLVKVSKLRIFYVLLEVRIRIQLSPN